jgi:hypothetical protein
MLALNTSTLEASWLQFDPRIFFFALLPPIILEAGILFYFILFI